MSRRREPPEDADAELEPPEEPEELEELEDVEYFVDVDDEDSWRTSVPKSAHSSQTSSSAPSTFTVFGFATSVPHISHWTILSVRQRRV
jgi:hypothetical protein